MRLGNYHLLMTNTLSKAMPLIQNKVKYYLVFN